jgi:hypothetical protein
VPAISGFVTEHINSKIALILLFERVGQFPGLPSEGLFNLLGDLMAAKSDISQEIDPRGRDRPLRRKLIPRNRVPDLVV